MKKHKKLIIRLAILVIVLAAIILWVSNPFKKSNLKKWQSQVSEADYQEAISYLRASEFASSKVPYLTFIEDKVVDYSLESKEAELVNTPSNTCPKNYNGVYFDASENYEVEYIINVATAGLYELELDYYVGEKVYNNLALQVYINDEIEFDEAKAIDVPLIWKDRTKEFSKDTYGDESLPIQDRILDWFTLSLFNNTYVSDTPLMFYLKEGENKIKIVNAQRGELYLGKLVAKAPTKYLSYSDYLEANNGQDVSMKALMINAIDYTSKNSSYVRLTAYQNPSVTPFGAVYKKINCIDGTAWNKNGQSITYEFDVAESGYYNIGFHYLNSKDQFSVFRTILIDGEVPFEEMLSYEIKAKSQSKWSYETLNDGKNNYKFYLEAGHHMLTIRAENSKVSQALRDIQFLIDHINQFSLQVKRLIGGDTADKNKSWNFLDLMPESEKLLKSYQLVIKYMVINLAKYSEDKDLSATISYLNTAINKLNQPIKKVDYLPLYLGLLYSGSGSVTQMLGDSLTRISTTPLYLDYINISGSNTKVKVKANANFFSRTWASTKTFFASFFSKKYKIKKDKTAITVWINRPLTYVDIIQKMVDSEFTTKTGIKVQISIMPDSNKLILANSAKQTPDIALGLASYIPYDLAIRGALADFTMFDDFYQVVSGKTSDDISIPAGVFVSQMLDDKIYGIPETLDFNALAYRKDVYDLYLAPAGISLPNTWDEVTSLVRTLQSYDMNFYYPTSGGTSLKWFYQTSSLIYQYGGSVYSEDGLSVAIDSKESKDALTTLAEFYTKYAFPQSVASFYNSFRYNKLPFGVTDFSTYLTLKNAAPELVGQWSITLLPGTKRDINKDGVIEEDEIDRSYIAAGTSGVIFKNKSSDEKLKQCWEFYKWWLSSSVQTEFQLTLQSTYGPEYVWLSSNINAVKNSSIDVEDKEIILQMVDWMIDINRTPGQYMVERTLSNIWNKMAISGVSPALAIESSLLSMNREVKKKMVEFGYIDNDYNILKPYYVRDKAWIENKYEGGNA